MDFITIAKQRMSVRDYKETKVEPEKLEQILEAAHVAPTAANLQPIRLIAVQSEEGLAKISKAANIYGAPLAIIVCADHDKAWVRPFDQKQTGDIDASILTDHMMLQATELGLGTVWVCYFKPDVLRKEFDLPANLEPVNILVVGYSDEGTGDPNRFNKLRTPMTTIKGFIDGILDGTIPPDMQNHYLQLVSEETGRLARLIQNMLDLSKLESGEYQVNARMFNIWETLTGVALSAEQRINDGMIELEGLTMDEKVLVYADPDLIHQVAYNLLDNAIKFTPAGGTIRFHVEKLGPEVEVSIWNSGQGISPEALPYVFQRFYKEDRSRGLHARGAGLGLNICKVLVNLSGGQIRVESQQGEWCRFVFTLPTCPPNPGEIKRLPDESGRPVPVEDPASMKPVN